MKSKTYWVIFLTVSVVVAIILLTVGGVFDFEKKQNNFSVGDNVKNISTNTAQNSDSDNGGSTNNKNETSGEIDIINSNTDFESDPEDFATEENDVSGLDKDNDFDSIDSEIY